MVQQLVSEGFVSTALAPAGRVTSVCAAVAEQAAAGPGRTAVVGPDGRSLTYGQLVARSDDLAARLAADGVGTGSCVGVLPGALGGLRRRRLRGAADGRRLPARWTSRPRGPSGVRARRRRRGRRRAHRRRDAAVPEGRGHCVDVDAWTTAPVVAVDARGPRPGRPRLRHLHVRLDRPAQGRRDHPREPGQPRRLARRRLRRRPRADRAQPGRRASASTPRCGRSGRTSRPGASAARRRRGDAPRRRSCCATGCVAERITSPSCPRRWPSS